jgi:hypothetical protein
MMTGIARFFAPFALMASTACASSAVPAAGTATPRAARDAPSTVAAAPASGGSAVPVLSDAQANRGRDQFRASCTACHSTDDFSNADFRSRWQYRSAGDLFDHISTTMPEDAPGSLPLAGYVDIVTYILRMNGFEAGASSGPLDESALNAISLAPFSGE